MLLCCFIPEKPRDVDHLNVSKELDESRNTLNKFVYSVSHDLQEPVRIVNSYVRLIEGKLKDSDDGELREYLSFAEDASRRLQSMISDLLSYSRITTQASPFTTVAASQILERVLLGMAERIKDSCISLSIGELPILLCDERQMSIVFEAIIDNAIKFRAAENPWIQITSRMVDHVNQIIVEDNGIGIERKMQDRVFDVFQRLHPRNRFSGNGMGLTLCRKIMERHGGRIDLESDSGKGLRVILTYHK
jgi:light-regulated signal transduction histidine kinase (bacteriophytochrome)